ncbi:MAG TPA: DUF5723 family protein [Edaphocola sp.]|nr:DUF5723 family protein [Edaphocola sp.]
MKKIILTGIGLFGGLLTFGQAHINTLTPSPIWSSEAAFLNPSYLKNNHRISINIAPLMGMNFNLKNNFISAGGIIKLLKQVDSGQVQSFAPVHELMDNLQEQNSVETATDLTLLHIGFKIGKPQKALNFGLSIRQHIYANATLNDDFFRLIYNGNKQFAGKTIALNPLVSAMAYTDIGIAASKTFNISKFQITPAVRVKYLLGEASVHSKGTQLNLFTQEDGEYLELTGQVKGQAGGALDFDKLIKGETDSLFDYKDIAKALGKGVGIDLGGNVTYKNISLSLGLVDIGSITYSKKNAVSISSSNPVVRWDGYDIVGSQEGVDYEGQLPSLDSLKLTTEAQEFTTALGAKLTFNGNFGLIEKKDKKGNPYYRHNFGLSYIQGFNNQYNSSSDPYISVYYLFNIKNNFTIGANFNHFRTINDLGANIGWRLAGLKMALGTNSLIGAFGLDYTKQADVFLYLGIGF